MTILGTRPEIIKLSPLLPLLDKAFGHKLIHTAQHYDAVMDSHFFKELRLRKPDQRLRPSGLSLGRMVEKITRELEHDQPNLVIVQGDTRSALAGALAAAGLGIPVAHVEAGCRSGDLKAPEEINRRLIDFVATYFFAADKVALNNLKREGHKDVQLVGNTGLDAVKRAKPLAKHPTGLISRKYFLVTLHRAENVDNPKVLKRLVAAIEEIAKIGLVVWPMHPRTQLALRRARLKLSKQIQVIPPQNYISTLSLLNHCLAILSDSGGLQEEAAVLNRPCFILRECTEWTRLVKEGKNFLVGTQTRAIVTALSSYAADPKLQKKIAARPATLPFGASQKIVRFLKAKLK